MVSCITSGVIAFSTLIIGVILATVMIFMKNVGFALTMFFFPVFLIFLAYLLFSLYCIKQLVACIFYLKAQAAALGGTNIDSSIVPVYIVNPGGPQVHFMTGQGPMGMARSENGQTVAAAPAKPFEDEPGPVF